MVDDNVVLDRWEIKLNELIEWLQSRDDRSQNQRDIFPLIKIAKIQTSHREYLYLKMVTEPIIITTQKVIEMQRYK